MKDSEGRIIGRYTTGTDGTVTVSGLTPNATYVVSEICSGQQLREHNLAVPIRGIEAVGAGEPLTTDAQGEIRITNLAPGAYVLTEIKAPVALGVQNEASGGTGLCDYHALTRFQTGDPDLAVLGGASGTGGTVIGTKVTGKNGTAIWTGLQPGTYVLEEVDPADGYSIIQSSETIFLADSGEQSVVTVRFTNMPDGTLLIRKVCSVNPSITLQNARWSPGTPHRGGAGQ